MESKEKRVQETELMGCYEDDEIDLYELWLTLKKRRKIVFGITVLFVAVALVLCFTMPKTYKTEATLMPLGGKKGSGLTSLISSLPIAVPLSGGQAGITLEAVLKSRILREKIVEDLDLLPVIFSSKWDEKTKSWRLEGNEKPPTILEGAEKLKDKISVSTDKKTGVITLSIEFPEDPKLAYKIAETALEEAENILNEKAFTLAKKYRVYVEKQLSLAKKRYEELEGIYRDFMRGKIKKVPFIIGERELNGLRSNIPEKVKANRLEKEIDKLKAKLNAIKGNNFVSLSDYQLNLQRLLTQMEVVKQLLSALAREYELAKAKEMRERISFQIIDPPYIPPEDKPYKPKKKLIIAVALVSGLFLGIFGAFFKEWLDNVRKRHEEEKVNA